MNVRRSAPLLLLVALCLVTGADAMIRTLPLSELVQRADFVFVVEVIARIQLPAPTPKDPPMIDTAVNVVRPLKGAWKGPEPIVFRTLGTIDGSMYIEDQPGFPAKGGRAVVFFRMGATGAPLCINGIQGVWVIDPATGELQGMGTGKTLAELETEIAAQQGR
ncbi:MAG: hypothetical protein GX442_24900 [Candidatus Riflebacteria bacterium]|nr:hypothetical protein [Candidatus Riflebacteria bacterium]